MVKVAIEYQGNLHTEAVHVQSGAKILTDAPLDNGGRGEAFSPTDLVATALGTCMATTMGLYANRHEIDLKGMKVTVLKEMAQQPVRRIAKLDVTIEVPLPQTHPHKVALEKAALTCPVHRSLHSDVDAPVTFRWVGSAGVSGTEGPEDRNDGKDRKENERQ
jgi:putative redox protein